MPDSLLNTTDSGLTGCQAGRYLRLRVAAGFCHRCQCDRDMVSQSMRGLFLSDLHLFSRRSVGQLRWEQWQRHVAGTSLLVLGGDIFDFRWSQYRTLSDSVTAAGHWLQDLLEAHLALTVAYVLGHHDCHPDLQQVLTALASQDARFKWFEFHFRLGDSLFLHGDVLDARSPGELQRYRHRFHETRARGAVANRVYDIAVAARLHHVAPRLLHGQQRVCRRLGAIIDAQSMGADQGVRNVFFGHTHRRVSRFSHNGQVFHNPGAGIRHSPFHPLTLELPQDWRQLLITPPPVCPNQRSELSQSGSAAPEPAS